MNTNELIRAVASNTGFTIKDVTPVVKETFNVIANAVIGGDAVKLPGFGNFTTSTRKAHTGTDPKTHELINIAETRNMKFTQSEMIKNRYRGE